MTRALLDWMVRVGEHRGMEEQEVRGLYRGKFVELVCNGRWEYARRTHGGSVVGIVALTPARELIVVEQYRIPVGANTLELPAGLVGDEEAGEAIEAAARRELLEETGYDARKWEYLFDGPSSAGLTDEQVQLLLASDLRKVHEGGGVGNERITVHLVPLGELEGFLDGKRRAGVLVDFKVRLAGYMLRGRAKE